MPFGLKNVRASYQRLVNMMFKMKLNPAKCTFGVSLCRFLGYLVTQQGIEAHPKQIRAILEMKSPTTLKEI
ncbi:hypothetical protein ACFX2I_025476 [Malus domestica]